MPKRDFKNKIIVITGAAGGLGQALCRRFGAAGAVIIGLDRAAASLEQLAQQCRRNHLNFTGYVCDVTDFEATQQILHNILQQFGRIEVLINNAGISHRSRFVRTNLSVIHQVMAVNFFGALHCTAAALPALIQNKGMIIVLSSVAGFSPLIGRTGYAASKHALHGFFESLRTEVNGEGVHILMVCPSFIATPINKNALGGDGKPVQHEQVIVGKKMPPDEAAQRIFTAASHEKKFLIIGKTGKLAFWMNKLLPQVYQVGMARRLKAEIA